MIDLTVAPSLWVVAIWADYPTPEEWKAWADAAIENGDLPQDWLIKLSLAQDRQQALDSLFSIVDASSVWSDDQLRDSGIGFYWMKYQSSRIDLAQCLNSAGRYADHFETSVECEYFFSLLNELEAGVDVEDKARELFEPYRRLAERNWQTLMDN